MSERILSLEGVENIRELGGYKTIDRYAVRWNKLIRSAELSNVTKKDEQFLKNYGVQTIVDLRSSSERKDAPDKLIADIQAISLPILDEESLRTSSSPESLLKELLEDMDGKTLMKQLYTEFVTDSYSVAAYGKFFEHLLENSKANRALLFHCTSGKDRTGFAAALFLSAVGVDRQIVEKDYLMTNRHLTKQRAAFLKKAHASSHISSQMMTSVGEIFQADVEYLRAAFDAIDTHYGSVGNFLVEGMGLDSLAQADLRELYLAK